MVTLRALPDAKGRVLGDTTEILVGGQHRQLMTNAQLRQEGVDRTYLYATAAAPVPQPSGINVIASIGKQERYG